MVALLLFNPTGENRRLRIRLRPKNGLRTAVGVFRAVIRIHIKGFDTR